MRCTACGEDVEPEADLCLACGEPLSEAMRLVSAPSPSLSPQAQLVRPVPSLQSELADALRDGEPAGSRPSPRLAPPFRPLRSSAPVPPQVEPLVGPAAVLPPRRRQEPEKTRCPGCGVWNEVGVYRCRGCGVRFRNEP